ncbi:MAG: MotA/TolQ/ExbB proton channel family protein [SAR324 cluster bacterium]|nr:MotA/TolQ/ExbB proton channel family protein [SAR324 cluster bacterium]
MVFFILLGMSVVSWAIIIRKWVYLSKLARKANVFLQNFDIAGGLSDVLLRSEQQADTFTTRLFNEAYSTYSDQMHRLAIEMGGGDRKQLAQKIEQRIEKAIILEKATMEHNLGLLATISSSAPFIGLLGTVTGIIDAFYSIAAQGASNIAVVAPGISAALVATAVGLFTAIPALMAYNIFREQTRSLSNKMTGFGLDLLLMFDQALDNNMIVQDNMFPEIKFDPKKN